MLCFSSIFTFISLLRHGAPTGWVVEQTLGEVRRDHVWRIDWRTSGWQRGKGVEGVEAGALWSARGGRSGCGGRLGTVLPIWGMSGGFVVLFCFQKFCSFKEE